MKTKRYITSWNKGIPQSEETKMKIRESWRFKKESHYLSEEKKSKLLKGMKNTYYTTINNTLVKLYEEQY